MTQFASTRQDAASGPEDAFVDLFAQVFGLEKAQLLVHEYPFRDIYDNGRFIDYALRTIDEQVAFEIDGLQWHHPEAVSIEKYEDGQLRQNSLVHMGWRVFRWTDRQVCQEPERVKEELAKFLERLSAIVSFDDFLPRQHGDALELPPDLELRPHQDEALQALARMRSEGRTIGLLYHAQGAGKTHVAVLDAKRLGRRTLFLAHRRELIRHPRASCQVFGGERLGVFGVDVPQHAGDSSEVLVPAGQGPECIALLAPQNAVHNLADHLAAEHATIQR
jgi:very-short-patch-repair endonuclease